MCKAENLGNPPKYGCKYLGKRSWDTKLLLQLNTSVFWAHLQALNKLFAGQQLGTFLVLYNFLNGLFGS